MNDRRPLLPAGATPLHERGAFELDVQHCELNLLRLLGAGSGRHPDVHRYGLPVDVDAESVFAFIAAQLPPRWRRVPVPEHDGIYRLAVWRRRRGLAGSRRIAIAVFDESAVGSDSAMAFRVLVVAREPG